MELHTESFDARTVIAEAVNGIRPMAVGEGNSGGNPVAGETIVRPTGCAFARF